VSATDAGIDSAAIEAAVTPKTRAVLATHLHGGLVPMSAVRAVADKYGFGIVEDAAQVAGARVEGRPAGWWGDVGILSFGGSKLLSAGRGGAILTARADLFQRVRLALSRGVQHWAALSELQAVVLGPQLDRLAEHTAERHRAVERLTSNLADVPGLRPFQPSAEGLPAFYKLGFYFDEGAFGLSREQFVKALRAEGVAFDPGFRALHVGRAASRFRAGGPLTNATTAGASVVILHHPVLALGNAAVDAVADAVRKAYRNAARLR
jgi:perosamine synthetase